MGDGSETGGGGSDAQQPQPNPVAVGHSNRTAPSPRAWSEACQQPMHGAVLSAFSLQFDMAQARGSNPYNMAAMSTALPPAGYRPYSHVAPVPQPQPQPHPHPHLHPHPQQYPVHGMPVPNQQYYLQQYPGMVQYYAPPVSQPSDNTQGRPHVGYYPGHIPGRVSAGYYMATGSYPPATPPTSSAQYGHPPIQAEMKLPPQNDGADGRQTGVRGPPRKPRQSGEYCVYFAACCG
jgi:hypothetical protein